MTTQADRQFHGSFVLLRLFVNLAQMFPRRHVDPQPTGALDHQAVVAAAVRTRIGVPGHDDAAADVRGSIGVVIAHLGELEDIRLIAGQDHLMNRGILDPSRFDQVVQGIPVFVGEFLFVDSQGRSHDAA